MPYADPERKREYDRRRRATIREQFAALRQSVQYDADGKVRGQSVQYAPEREPYVPLPDATLARRSTLVDAEGNVLQRWEIEKPDLAARDAAWREIATALAEGLPRAEPIPAPAAVNSDLCACYPIGDHHMGMLAWKYETGDSYDLDIGERLIGAAMAHLVEVTPACNNGLVVFLGDFMHYDSFVAVTPTSKNPLDADGRFPKMVRAGIRSMRRVIEMAAARHFHVRVIVEIGNHDLASSIFLMECLHNIYENDPRISIDTSPRHFHYFSFGHVLVGTHHGHGVKAEQLPMIMATDQPEAWGAAKHRYWWTGHVHSRTAHDFRGFTVESFRILPPPDAWAANSGYRPIRDMKAIVLHREHGEVARYIVNPEMLRHAA